VAGLVERDDELALLLALADAGEGRLVLLSGEAGAGKTALLRAWRERLGDGCRAMMGRCEPLAAPTPLGPLFEMLPSFPDHVAELLVGGGQRAQLFAAVLEELSAVRSMLVFDDVHFADEATVDLVRYLGRRIEDTPSVLVTAYRPGQIGRTHPFRGVLGELGRHITRIELRPLTVAGVGAHRRDHHRRELPARQPARPPTRPPDQRSGGRRPGCSASPGSFGRDVARRHERAGRYPERGRPRGATVRLPRLDPVFGYA